MCNSCRMKAIILFQDVGRGIRRHPTALLVFIMYNFLKQRVTTVHVVFAPAGSFLPTGTAAEDALAKARAVAAGNFVTR